jgi:hypothetical protein
MRPLITRWEGRTAVLTCIVRTSDEQHCQSAEAHIFSEPYRTGGLISDSIPGIVGIYVADHARWVRDGNGQDCTANFLSSDFKNIHPPDMVTDFNNVDIKVVSPVKLAHVVLRTNQLDKMADFYITFLGGTYAFQVPNLLAFLTYDDEHHRIGLIGMPDIKAKDKNTNGLEVSPPKPPQIKRATLIS